MEWFSTEQEDSSLMSVSLHNINLRLTNSPLSYENMDSIQCEPYVNYAECVCRELDKCRCQPVKTEPGMQLCTVNTSDSASVAAEAVNDAICHILPTVDNVSSMPMIETKQIFLDETAKSCISDDVGGITNSDETDLCCSSEAEIENTVLDSAVKSMCEHSMPNKQCVDVIEQDSAASLPREVGDGEAVSEYSTFTNLDLSNVSTRDLNEVSESGVAETDTINTTMNIDTALLTGLDSEQVNPQIMIEEISDLDVVPLLLEANSEDNKKKGCRVRFHEHHVVSSYLEPSLPWIDANLCSTVELVSAYRNACKLMAVKPLTKVLQQLEVITSFEERHELLSLRGENIDTKICETLEEVFRRVRFRAIDLEATSLDEDTAVTMFDLLDYYESCQRLNISFNKNLGIRGWQACARFIKKTACLDVLEARGCSFNDPAMTMMGRSLRLGSIIKSLHLENCFLSGRPLMLLVAAVKFNEILRELFLADNKLTPSDGIQLGSLLKTNRALCLLDLRNNLLQDVGLHHICDGLCEQTTNTGLNTLVVWNNQVTYEAMGNVARALTCVKNLETINLGHNNITNEGIHRLKDGLLHNKSLLRIGLQTAKISCEGAVALAEFIAESLSLLRLDLRGNHIRTGGLMALTLSLKVNQSVTRLDLDQESKKEAGVRDYAEQQRRLLADIATYTARNLSILAGTATPSSNYVVPFADVDLPETVLPLGGANRPSLTLSTEFVTRSDSLESPAYVPSSDPILSPVNYGDSYIPLSDAITSPVTTDASENLGLSSSDSVKVSNIVSKDEQRENELDVAALCESVSTPTESAPPSTLTSKTSSLAATVRRKFTVTSVSTSKPVDSLVPVVLFTKTLSPTDYDDYDDGNARVCFPATSSADGRQDIESKTDDSESCNIDNGEVIDTTCQNENEPDIKTTANEIIREDSLLEFTSISSPSVVEVISEMPSNSFSPGMDVMSDTPSNSTPLGVDVISDTPTNSSPSVVEVISEIQSNSFSPGMDVMSDTPSNSTPLGVDVISDTPTNSSPSVVEVISEIQSDSFSPGKDVMSDTPSDSTPLGVDVISDTPSSLSPSVVEVISEMPSNSFSPGEDVMSDTPSNSTPLGVDVISDTPSDSSSQVEDTAADTAPFSSSSPVDDVTGDTLSATVYEPSDALTVDMFNEFTIDNENTVLNASLKEGL